MCKNMNARPFVSIIIPAKNEEHLIRQCIHHLNRLNYPKDLYEIIVADGMSADRTAEAAEKLGAVVVKNEKETVSPGRNIAFLAAKGDLVAFTDADCVVDKDWLRNAIKYFKDDKVGCVGGPNFTPENETPFGKAVGFVFGEGIFAAGSIHARNLNEIKAVKSIPGCNAIYKREVLEKTMPVDESLLTCDDTELNQRIIDEGYDLLYTPDVYVWHYRRPSPRKLWRQMYRYAIGRLQVGKRNWRMINIVHILVGVSLPVSVSLLIFSPRLFLFLLSIYLVMVFAYSIKGYLKIGSLKAALWIAPVISIILFSWSCGFMRELFFPLKKVS